MERIKKTVEKFIGLGGRNKSLWEMFKSQSKKRKAYIIASASFVLQIRVISVILFLSNNSNKIDITSNARLLPCKINALAKIR